MHTSEQGAAEINAYAHRPAHLPQLDVIRSLACLSVLSSHLVGERLLRVLPVLPFGLDRSFRFLLINGGDGVRAFFVLSGFLITHLILSELSATGRLDFRAFYARRTLRIWPLYALVLLIGFVVVPAAGRLVGTGDMTPQERFWPFAFFLGNFEALAVRQSGLASIVIGPTWSISIEEQFYLVWPFLLVALRSRRIWAPFLAILGASGSFLYWRTESLTLYFHTIPNLLPIALGSLAAIVCSRFPTTVQRIQRSHRLSFSTVAVLIAVATHGESDARAQFLNSLAVSTFVAVWCMSATNRALTITSPIGRWLAWLGTYTYSLYMLHTSVDLSTRVIARRLGWPDAPAPMLLLGLAQLGLAICLAVFSYRFFERPFLKLKDRFAVPHR